MKPGNESPVRNNACILQSLREGQSGQSIMVVMIALAGILGAAALVFDVGRVYYGYQQLKAQTQAAALAGGSVMSNDGETASEVQTTATDFSGNTGDANANSSNLLTSVTVSSTPVCLTSAAATAEGVPPCNTYSIGDNALRVTETATVATTFAAVLGYPTWHLSYTALASAKGGFNGPYNVAIIVDTTASMNTTDGGTNCSGSRISCALEGVQTLLGSLSPCPGGLTSCGGTTATSVAVPAPATGDETATNVTTTATSNAVDEVALFTFPGLAADGTNITNVNDDVVCPTSNPPITSYNALFLNTSCTGSKTPVSCCTSRGEGTCNSTAIYPVYQIVPFSSDYRTSDSATSLNASSDLVVAAGGGSCAGMAAPGGEGTFYAGAIKAAQSALATAAANRPNTKNVMILVSDGDATATTSEGLAEPSSSPLPSPVYSATAECQQAVTAAQNAASAGTTVYAVAYGAESSGCTSGDTLTPICTMQQIANSPTSTGGYTQNNQNFFTDETSTTSGCAASARSTGTLNQIFKAISSDLTVSRLIPNSTT
jgi:hypothetical protein